MTALQKQIVRLLLNRNLSRKQIDAYCRRWGPQDVDDALIALRNDGIVAYSLGFWWLLSRYRAEKAWRL